MRVINDKVLCAADERIGLCEAAYQKTGKNSYYFGQSQVPAARRAGRKPGYSDNWQGSLRYYEGGVKG